MRETLRDERVAQVLSDDAKIEILRLLDKKGPMTISEVSKALGKHRSSVYRHLVALENAELVTREAGRGAHVFAVSGLGREALQLLSRGSPEILLEVRRRRLSRRLRARRVLVALAYAPAAAFAAIGVKGAAYTGSVHALSRILWLTIFVGLAALWIVAVRRALRKGGG